MKESAKENKDAERRRLRQFKAAPTILILVGLPGSGKSHFARRLAQSSDRWVYVSQDELRSRALAEQKFSEVAMASPRTGVKVILDRCNAEPQDRAYWLALASKPRDAGVVFFDVAVETCRERMKARTDHPTIPFGSGDAALDSFVKKLVPPTKEEGFASVRVVKTFEDSDRLLQEFGGVVADTASSSSPSSTAEPGPSDPEVTTAAASMKDLVIMDDDGSSEPPKQRTPVARPAVARPAVARPAVAKPNAASKRPQNGKGKARDENDSDDEEATEGTGYFKFPRTRHIADMGSATRDDLLFTEREAQAFYSKGQVISIEEKVDGANLGISITSNYEIKTQNRAHFVNSSSHKQFGQLDAWIEEHRSSLFEILEPGRHILFGEWLYAKHSIFYSRLPGYFMAFDVYDQLEGKFLSREARNRMLEGTGIPVVPLLHHGPVQSREELLSFLERPSQLAEGPLEGIYCRIDEGDYLKLRGKIVRSEFLQQIDQPWTHHTFTKNKILYSYD